MKRFLSVGVDLASSPEYGSKRYYRVGLATLSDSLELTEVAASGFTDTDILAFIARHQPQVVAIDSPLSLPAGRCCSKDSCQCAQHGIVRAADRALAARGYHPLWTLLPSMQPLTQRGIALRSTLERSGTRVIEVFPGAAQDALGIPRKQYSRELLSAGLRRLGITRVPDDLNGDALDAVTAAYVGCCFLRGKYEALGPPEEEQVIIPLGMAGTRGPAKTSTSEDKRIKIWYDPEADYLEVTFKERPGTFKETPEDQVMAKVDSKGEIIGFSILKVSTLKGTPLELSLAET